MSLRTPGLHFEIAQSTMNFSPIKFPGLPSMGSGLAEFESYLNKTELYNNFEIHPTRTIDRDCQNSRNIELARRVIGSLHQTFNTGAGFQGKVMDAIGIQQVGESVRSMQDIQYLLGQPVPSVRYVNWSETSHAANRREGLPTSYAVVQPAAQLYKEGESAGEYNIEKNNVLLRELAARGIVGLCPDTAHARCNYDKDTAPPPWEEVWPEQFSSGRVFQMHASIGRNDLRGRDSDFAETSQREFEAFISGKSANTQMGDMLTAAIENWKEPEELAKNRKLAKPVLRIVVEVGPQLLPRPQAQFERLAENLANVAREAGASLLKRYDG